MLHRGGYARLAIRQYAQVVDERVDRRFQHDGVPSDLTNQEAAFNGGEQGQRRPTDIGGGREFAAGDGRRETNPDQLLPTRERAFQLGAGQRGPACWRSSGTSATGAASSGHRATATQLNQCSTKYRAGSRLYSSRAGSRRRPAGLEPRQSRRVQTCHSRTDCRKLAIRQRHGRLLPGYRQLAHETDANVPLPVASVVVTVPAGGLGWGRAGAGPLRHRGGWRHPRRRSRPRPSASTSTGRALAGWSATPHPSRKVSQGRAA